MLKRFPLPITILVGLAALAQFVNALFLRVNLMAFAGDSQVTTFAQVIANRVSSRSLAFSIIIVVALLLGERRTVGYLFIMWAIVETQDVISGLLDFIQGRVAASLLFSIIPLIVFIALYIIAARWLLSASNQPK